MTKTIYLVMTLLFMLGGCSSKHYYMLSSPHAIASAQKQAALSIGVESIMLPDYLREGKVALLDAGNRIRYLKDALWAVNMQDDLTNALIFDLQKSLPESRVFHYPWEKRGRADAIVSVRIKRFIAGEGYVWLDALVRINDRDRVVSIKEPLKSRDEAQIVAAMKRAFFTLEHEVIAMLDDIGVSQKR